MTAGPVFSDAAPTKPRPQFGLCPVCWRICPLTPTGRVGTHLELRMSRKGPYTSDKWCSGYGNQPETVTVQP